MNASILLNLQTRVVQTDKLTAAERHTIHALFDLGYGQANHGYLDQSLTKLRFLALAHDQETPVGFAVGDAVIAPLPRMAEPQCVILAGICCIAPGYRRLGLFTYLESLAIRESGVVRPEERSLSCGRMAHPASFRIIRGNPTVVPKYGHAPTEWQKEVGLCVAELYGVHLDPETFVVIGKGKPIGYPKIDIKVEEEEWLPFRSVNRDRGDSLLGIAWNPDAPEGW
ncbi:MAG: hypothetical protein A2Y79_11750 [Deltaproteobacteria bacterium RBG_13_43_22]|jgi:hypothetical protein|nr:MAG: hypothetical protein A2Y79_11750 [Deltaproteobacteria bacterium RBG_13_43_22]